MALRPRNSEAPSTPSAPLEIGVARPCAAYGCPLGGTFSPTTVGEAREWWCYIHSSLGPVELQRATQLIRQSPHLQEVIRTSRLPLTHPRGNRGEYMKSYQQARQLLAKEVMHNLHISLDNGKHS